MVQGAAKNAETILPVIHVLFSNIKAWLNGTFHGVSAKHLPRYATEWTYRFNRRGRIDELADFVLRRAVGLPDHHIPPARRRPSTTGRNTCFKRIGTLF